jgi:hypothetical protein
VTDLERALADLHADLGYRRLSPAWAKLEIVLGLAAAGAGLFLGPITLREADWAGATGALALFVLGGYLALAGHRSHLYRSMNDRTAYLAALIRPSREQEKNP